MTAPRAALCRDCAFRPPRGAGRCPACGSPRLLDHAELDALALAHIDCDAFYATVEKRDDPTLLDKPVIVGGGHRGVVAACCYVARLYGVRSAMPMFKALAACPHAVVIRPDMAKYRDTGRAVRALMREVTPLVEPLSIDEAFLDLSGTETLYDMCPAETLVRLVQRIEIELGITASVGLSYNKLLAKLASERDKPRGFAVIGRGEARAFLAPQRVGVLWGVGEATERQFARAGIYTLAQLQGMDERTLTRRFGRIGGRLARFARGEDDRPVTPTSPTKSVSSETTFDTDVAGLEDLAPTLRRLCERVAERLRASAQGGSTVTLKLKTGRFATRTRSRRLTEPTQRADLLYRTARALLEPEVDGTRYRLLGIGVGDIVAATSADPPDLFDSDSAARVLDGVVDQLCERHGAHVVTRGTPPARRPG